MKISIFFLSVVLVLGCQTFGHAQAGKIVTKLGAQVWKTVAKELAKRAARNAVKPKPLTLMHTTPATPYFHPGSSLSYDWVKPMSRVTGKVAGKVTKAYIKSELKEKQEEYHEQIHFQSSRQ